MCRTMDLQPNYIMIKINGQTPRDKRTKQKGVIYRINQEIKYLYQKKQYLNTNLYHQHLQAAHLYKGMWQHALEEIDKQNNKYMENRYETLNKKLDKLKKQHTQEISGIDQKTRKKTEIRNQPRIINLTEIKINQEQKTY